MKTDRIEKLMEAYCTLCIASETGWTACSILDSAAHDNAVWKEYAQSELHIGRAKDIVMDDLEEAGHPILRAHVSGWRNFDDGLTFYDLEKMLKRALPNDFEGDSESDGFHGQCTSEVVKEVREFLESHKVRVTVTVEYAKPLGICNWYAARRWLKNHGLYTRLMKLGERVKA